MGANRSDALPCLLAVIGIVALCSKDSAFTSAPLGVALEIVAPRAPLQAPAGCTPHASHAPGEPVYSANGVHAFCTAAAGLALVVLAGSRRHVHASRHVSRVRRFAVAVGEKVTWKGIPGTVAFYGKTKFAGGEWVGVALDEPSGSHDGTVMGEHYFTCSPRTGIFALESMLAVDQTPQAAVPAVATGQAMGSSMPSPSGQEGQAEVLSLLRAPPSYFGSDKLVSKGPRSDADKGCPSCSNRVLYKHGASYVGAWSCTEGGFPVLNRPTTEVFYVLEGEGFVTDADGTPHCFRAGDTVVLPKGWSGRWDILKAIRKVFVVNNHAETLSIDESRRAVIGTPESFQMSQLSSLGKRKADWGEPEHFNRPLWKVGPTNVGAWACTAGGFQGTPNRPTTEVFYVLEGLCFLTNIDGSAQRVTAGDTVVLPKGWSGRWDIIEPIRKVFVVISE